MPTVRELCGLFVSIRDERIYLIHQTAKEFFVAKETPGTSATFRLQTLQWNHSFDPQMSHYTIAMSRIMYICCIELKVRPLISSKDSKEALSVKGH